MIIIFAIFVIALILAGSAWPDIPPVSQYELERRRQQNNRTAIHQLRRIAVYDDLVSLQRCVVALLLVLMVMAALGHLTLVVVCWLRSRWHCSMVV